jgi:hypothetical protein
VGSAFALGIVLCCLLGADIAFDANSPVPNPNNMPLTVQGSGTFKLEKNEKLSTIVFIAQNKDNGQLFANGAQLDFINMKWTQILNLNPKGDYECWAVISWRDNNNNSFRKETEKITVTVK